MHSLNNRFAIALITAFLSTITVKIFFYDSIETSRLWYVFSLYVLLLITYGIIASYIIDWLASFFKMQIMKILIRILLFIIVGSLPFLGSSNLMIAGIIAAVFYVLTEALFPQNKKR
ncbi:hypothetical protein [Kurthia sibirica]|uniref:Uncharacterized protein n=1 Tax=Kurthia sibirica TaxID=202750 RepID=A0A2U3AHT9_9BACL|nr:hypothetical protein [Kurthia sibirica]PWI24122.1 hypothetical protein DEX24_15115 [Kurthia sibirica]GEK35301.1 hypothetical protein KSI01_28340 [Kurthia sibirica]